MPRSAARAATRKNRAPRSASIPSAMRWASGIPKNQRPELWNIFNSRINKGESIRVFPLSNWTELDVWLYIHAEEIPDRAAVFREASAKPSCAAVRSSCADPSKHASAARRKNTDGEVPHAVARLRSVHRRDSLRRRHGPENHRGDGFLPALGARKPRDRSRRRRLDGNQEAGGLFLMVMPAAQPGIAAGASRSFSSTICRRICCGSPPPAAWTTANPR